MVDFKKNLITNILLILLVINSVVSWLMPKEKEVNLDAEIKLHDILQEREVSEQKSREKDSIINLIFKKNEEIKNDVAIDTASANDLRSMFTEYRNRK